MFENKILLLSVSTFFASIPVAIWLYIFFTKSEKSKKTVALIFLLGCLTAPALLGVQYLWDIFPQFNLAALIEDNIATQSRMFIMTFLLFAAMEEIIKMWVVKIIDQKTTLINRVNDSLRYSITSALGFSFTENAYYLYQFWDVIGTGELIGLYIFRSIFTTCAHIIFSGVFGYYYGIGKFAISLEKQELYMKKPSLTSRAIAKLFNIPITEGYRQQAILKGLIIAIGMHLTFNYLLQFNIILPVIIAVALGYLFLRHLLSRKTGYLVLLSDPTETHASSMAKKDEEVVIELLALWFEDQRYVDVIHICERLLERDPDNSVVKLFKSKAMDKMDDKDTYKEILGTVLKDKNKLSDEEKNIMSKYIAEKEAMQKNMPQNMPKNETTESQISKDPLDNYTGEGTFRI